MLIGSISLVLQLPSSVTPAPLAWKSCLKWGWEGRGGGKEEQRKGRIGVKGGKEKQIGRFEEKINRAAKGGMCIQKEREGRRRGIE